jgi:predicted kinase
MDNRQCLVGGKKISYDEIEEKLGNWSLENWHRTRLIGAENARKAMEDGEKWLFIDDNMYYRSMVKPYLKLCCERSYHFLHVILEAPLDLCLFRNSQRSIKVPEDHIIRMHQILSNETFWPFSLKISNENLDTTISLILSSLNSLSFIPTSHSDSSPKSEQDRQATLESILHQSDLCLRKLSNSFISQSSNKQQASKLASQLKKEILVSIRNIEGSLEEILNIVEESWIRYLIMYGL